MKNGLRLDDDQINFRECCLDMEVLIVFCDAAAGSGKTTIAMDAANVLVHDKRNDLSEIVYIVSPYGEGRQGYLPGTLTEKSEVYFEPAYQAMIECGMTPYADVCTDNMAASKKDTDRKKPGDGYVRLLTHTYLRGTNLKNKVVIIDEAQNFTAGELKKVLTRVHDSCKVIVIGHTGQIDIEGRSGFARYMRHFEGQEKCRVCQLRQNYRGWISAYADQMEE